jgi:hypothetical protein
MATEAVIGSTVAAAEVEVTIEEGASVNYACYGLKGAERVDLLGKSSDGSYTPITYSSDSGWSEAASINCKRNTLSVRGPLDLKLKKSATESAVEVVKYS